MAVTRADGADFDALFAGADLTSALMLCARIGSDGRLVLAGAGDVVYGVITEVGNVNDPVTVQVRAMGKVIAGAAVNYGVRIASDGNGKAVQGTTGVFGIARNSVSAANQVLEFEFDRN